MLGRAKLLLASTLIAGAFAGSAPARSDGGLALLTDEADSSGNTFTSAASFCTSGSTGFLDPSANAADTGGNGNGFEANPAGAYVDGSDYASNVNGPDDRHRFSDYDVAVASYCAVKGIEVRLDWWLDSMSDATSISVELSWDGGTTWTSVYTDSTKSTTEHTVVLGGATDTWGRSWTLSELSNANFRVRLTCNCSGGGCSSRSYYLDWVPVDVYYGPP